MENVAVIGASPKSDRYSNKAIKMLIDYGHTPIPVAPTHDVIEGLEVYQSPDQIAEVIDTVILYLGPARQESIIKGILKLAPKRVIFNPGTESEVTKKKFESAGIKVIEACTLVLLKTNQF